MSLIDYLYPENELEALGNKWQEPAPKRRRLDSEVVERRVSAYLRRQQYEAARYERSFLEFQYLQRQRYEAARYERRFLKFQEQVAARSYARRKARASKRTRAAINELYLPRFIEPSLLKSCSRCNHPDNRHEEPIPPSPQLEAQSPASSADNHATPAEIRDQYRSGPFGYIFDGLRLTDQERDFVEELTSPSPPMEAQSPASSADDDPTPAEICDQFQFWPYGYIFDELQLTGLEQD